MIQCCGRRRAAWARRWRPGLASRRLWLCLSRDCSGESGGGRRGAGRIALVGTGAGLRRAGRRAARARVAGVVAVLAGWGDRRARPCAGAAGAAECGAVGRCRRFRPAPRGVGQCRARSAVRLARRRTCAVDRLGSDGLGLGARAGSTGVGGERRGPAPGPPRRPAPRGAGGALGGLAADGLGGGRRGAGERVLLLHPAFGDFGLHRLLQLLEGPHLDLAYPLARDAVLLAEFLERGRVILEAALDQNVALAVVQRFQRPGEQRLAAAELLAVGDQRLLAFALVDQPVLPLALAVGADGRDRKS